MGEMGQGSPHLEVAGRPATLEAAGRPAARGEGHAGHGHPTRHASHHEHKHKHHRKRHHKKHRKHHRRHLGTAGHALPTAPAKPPPPSSAPVPAAPALLTQANANRLLWRAGFGPTPGQAASLAGQPVQQVVYSLTRPSGPAVLSGPAPVEEEGHPLDPVDAWGQDHCWWLDRMVRSDQQLVERMTYIWHDWFANSNEKVDSQQLMLDQNELFREQCLGSFHDLFTAVTANPAMLVFLDGIYNEAGNSNKNYAREMMELFSLGADRGAYTEDDVREMGRVLTGFTAEWSSEEGLHNFHYEPARHDEEDKTVFGQTGNWNWEDAVRLCVEHPLHPSFFVTKLWGYFIPTPPDEQTLAALQGCTSRAVTASARSSRRSSSTPTSTKAPSSSHPPSCTTPACCARSPARSTRPRGRGSTAPPDSSSSTHPTSPAGTSRGGWTPPPPRPAGKSPSYVTAKTYPNPWPGEGEPVYDPTEEPDTAFAHALAYWAEPLLSAESRECIAAFAESCLDGRVTAEWEDSPFRALRQNALRMLIATAPDLQVS